MNDLIRQSLSFEVILGFSAFNGSLSADGSQVSLGDLSVVRVALYYSFGYQNYTLLEQNIVFCQ